MELSLPVSKLFRRYACRTAHNKKWNVSSRWLIEYFHLDKLPALKAIYELTEHRFMMGPKHMERFNLGL